MSHTFEELVAEAESVSVEGWDFSWLEGRATEERPSWGYQRVMSARLATASAALDIQTGGGEVLAGAATFPPTMAATESWPPNVARATRLLHPRGAVVVATPDEPPLPFADAAFDLVTSRHPATVWWTEIARVLQPGGTYFAQHVGPRTVVELVEFFLGPQPKALGKRHPDNESAAARAAGLEIVTLRMERLRMEFFDIGAVIYFLRTSPSSGTATGCVSCTTKSRPKARSSPIRPGRFSRPASPYAPESSALPFVPRYWLPFPHKEGVGGSPGGVSFAAHLAW